MDLMLASDSESKIKDNIDSYSTVLLDKTYSSKSLQDIQNYVGNFNLSNDSGVFSSHVINGYSRPDTPTATVQLSAQVMNLPLKIFKKSISCEVSDKIRTKGNEFLPQDIIRRIKEIYDACSCKICECITGDSMPVRNNTCNCEPCNCKDCTSYLEKLKSSLCSSLYCNQELGIKQDCNCRPCDCVQCTRNAISQSCNCKPCECVECKSMFTRKIRTMVVAPVEESNQRTCQCTPVCECANCTHNYGLSRNIRREIATGINRHENCHCETCINDACEFDGTNSCTCARNTAVLRKPIEKNPQDFDIRPTITKNLHWCNSKYNKNNTIAMYATFLNKNTTVVDKNIRKCYCSVCECIVCQCKNYLIDAESLQKFQIAQDVSSKYRNYCKCLPCECQICKQKCDENLIIKEILSVSDVDQNIKRAQETLKKAKQFSLELSQLLLECERENYEFESISKKLRLSQELPFNDEVENLYTNKDNFNLKLSPFDNHIPENDNPDETITTTEVLRDSNTGILKNKPDTGLESEEHQKMYTTKSVNQKSSYIKCNNIIVYPVPNSNINETNNANIIENISRYPEIDTQLFNEAKTDGVINSNSNLNRFENKPKTLNYNKNMLSSDKASLKSAMEQQKREKLESLTRACAIMKNIFFKQTNEINVMEPQLQVSKTHEVQENSALKLKSIRDDSSVNFLDVRRVSDHSVLMKWNPPRALNDVQGYEILVNGKSVKKIVSSSQNLAVVTCLPNCQKLLLTIRTVTTTEPKSGHYPCSTIVYHPRDKSSM